MYLIWIFGSKLLRSNNQSRATLWVLETCLIVGLLPSMIILITASVSFKYIQQSFLMRSLDVWGNTINIIQHVDLPLRFLTSVSDNKSHRSLCSLSHVSKNRNNQIPQFESKKPVQSQSSVQRDNFRFCWAVRNGRLFLAHPTYWNKGMTSRNAQCSSRSGFWILKNSRRMRVLKQSQSTLSCSITHITILFLFTCMMNVRNQSIQAFVISFGPFCNRSYKFVHRP